MKSTDCENRYATFSSLLFFLTLLGTRKLISSVKVTWSLWAT